MISPYVRRLRLAAELRGLRAKAGLTHEQLAKRIGESRAQISRLENGHVVDQADVMKILDAVGVDGERWTQVMTIAREAGEKGWSQPTRWRTDSQEPGPGGNRLVPALDCRPTYPTIARDSYPSQRMNPYLGCFKSMHCTSYRAVETWLEVVDD